MVDIDKFTQHLRTHAKAHSQGQCAKAVRLALEAGGANTSGHPAVARDWGKTLERIGFTAISIGQPEQHKFEKGDVMIMQPYVGGSRAGHIAAFDGKSWISDFLQTDFWAGPNYRKARPSYAVYRL